MGKRHTRSPDLASRRARDSNDLQQNSLRSGTGY